jgi:transposase-like protein
MAVERLKTCDNIVELSQELGVHRRLLYKWRDQFDPFDAGEESPPGNSREATLRKKINQLKRVLVDKTMELDFFKVPCKKSRLDSRRAVSVARRRLRRNPRSDAIARQLKHRANVSAGGGESSRFLSFSAKARSGTN